MKVYYLACQRGASSMIWGFGVMATSFAQACAIANANGFIVTYGTHWPKVVTSTPY